jgi:hypothetical protein
MTVGEISKHLDANTLTGEKHIDDIVLSAFGSDLMSDVLAFATASPVLLTGLLNPQVIRTAEMMDIKCIVFVRGKIPDNSILQLACEYDISIMHTELSMYTACGKLYGAGLRN